MGRTAPQPLELTIDADEQAPRRARALVRRLDGLVTPQTAIDLELVISELVTNAFMHGPGGSIAVRLELRAGGRVWGEVADPGEGRVTMRPGADDTGGMGLRLVDAVARWGVSHAPTRVWFELPRV